MNKEQKEINKRVNRAFCKLHILSNITWTPYRDELFNMNRKDEKQHRFGDWAEHHKGSASINDCAKLFTVKHIAEELDIKPTVLNKAIKIAYKNSLSEERDAFDDMEMILDTIKRGGPHKEE